MKEVIKSALVNEIPKLSERTGISKEWLALWYEVEIFYGDVQKSETRQQLLLRLQDEYHLSPLKEQGERSGVKTAEYIICAAIHFNDGIEHEHQPDNIFDGFVVTGRRHHNCYATLTAIAKSINLDDRIRLLVDKTDRDRQGFITNFNRFVDRREGYLIAKKSGQLIHNMHDQSDPILISEDLY